MAAEETNIVHTIMLETSKSGARLFKNVRGHFYTFDSVKILLAAIKSANWGKIIEATRNMRQVKAGILAAGASDLIGFMPTKITPEMIGKTIAIFVACEVKANTGATEEQQSFISFVLKNGGLAGIARSPEDARKIIHLGLA